MSAYPCVSPCCSVGQCRSAIAEVVPCKELNLHVTGLLKAPQQTSSDPPGMAVCAQRLIESMDNAKVDVLVFPTWSNPARLIGDYYSPDGAPCILAMHA